MDVGSPLVGADAPLRVEIEVDDFPLIARSLDSKCIELLGFIGFRMVVVYNTSATMC